MTRAYGFYYTSYLVTLVKVVNIDLSPFYKILHQHVSSLTDVKSSNPDFKKNKKQFLVYLHILHPFPGSPEGTSDIALAAQMVPGKATSLLPSGKFCTKL